MRIWEGLADAEPLFFPEASPEMPLVLQTSSAIIFCGHVSWEAAGRGDGFARNQKRTAVEANHYAL